MVSNHKVQSEPEPLPMDIGQLIMMEQSLNQLFFREVLQDTERLGRLRTKLATYEWLLITRLATVLIEGPLTVDAKFHNLKIPIKCNANGLPIWQPTNAQYFLLGKVASYMIAYTGVELEEAGTYYQIYKILMDCEELSHANPNHTGSQDSEGSV
jgi:hypothetical protein